MYYQLKNPCTQNMNTRPCQDFLWMKRLLVSCKTRNHPQTSQTTHKLAKPPTNHKLAAPPTNQPNHPQTSQIMDKPPTNQPKIASFFPEDIYYD